MAQAELPVPANHLIGYQPLELLIMPFVITEQDSPNITSRVIVVEHGESRVTLSICAEEQVQLAGESLRYAAISIINSQLADVLVQIAAKALNSRYAMNITAPAED